MSSPQRAASLTTPDLPSTRTLQTIGRTIEQWGVANRRTLPWRNTRDPWHILVAEVALQQTQAARVAERFEELTTALATPTATVQLGKSGVIALWSGLGYNARAVRLFQAANAIVGRFGGRVPKANDDLRSLPGVGPYTAAAVEAFAYERDVAIYDTNVARVIARAISGVPLSATQGWQVATQLVPAGSGWSYNQAILDLGATVCTARTPECERCPLRHRCVWKQRGSATDPAKKTAGTSRGQSRFEGSARQARGRIIERLRQGAATVPQLASVTGWEHDAVSLLLEALVAEGLVTHRSTKYFLG